MTCNQNYWSWLRREIKFNSEKTRHSEILFSFEIVTYECILRMDFIQNGIEDKRNWLMKFEDLTE